MGISKEKCLLIAVDTKLEERRSMSASKQGQTLPIFSLKESLSELSELVGTAGLQVRKDTYYESILTGSTSNLLNIYCELGCTIATIFFFSDWIHTIAIID